MSKIKVYPPRIKFLKSTFGNDKGDVVSLIQWDDLYIYYYDGFHRYCYLPKTDEGVYFEYIVKLRESGIIYGTKEERNMEVKNDCPICKEKIKEEDNKTIRVLDSPLPGLIIWFHRGCVSPLRDEEIEEILAQTKELWYN